ncbi:MAG: hypothetical protein LAT81_14430 [Oceanicaulis sp.]|nr:hypothetical protein [Oceanicaulis sp.]
MTFSDEPLDCAISEWSTLCKERVSENLLALHKEKPWFRNPRIRISFNDRALLVSGGDDRCSVDMFTGPETDRLVEIFKNHTPDFLWPLVLNFEISGLDRDHAWRSDIDLHDIEMFGMLFEPGKGILEKKWNHVTGVDRLIGAGALLERLIPPSNQPVRTWSEVTDFMGHAHVRSQKIYARSEPEALIKIAFHKGGMEKIQSILKDGRLSTEKSPFRTWFTSTDIIDLDIHPEGKTLSREDILDALNSHLSTLDTSIPDP